MPHGRDALAARFTRAWSADADAPPKGIAEIDPGIRQSAARRLDTIRRDLENAGARYPRDEVRAALAYWKTLA